MKSEAEVLFSLQTAHSVKDVAYALGLDPEKFFYVVQRADDGHYYDTFKIPKKSGGERDIAKPKKGLALAQARLVPILSFVYSPGECVKGFVKGSSFLDNAHYHHAQRWVLNIDLLDFFPSVTFARVRGLFMSSLFSFNPRVATILARICTFQGGLPQGATTSPILANLIAKSLDKRLTGLARTHRLKYSRYSDDITLSCSKAYVPKSIVSEIIEIDSAWEVQLGSELKDIIRHSGFRVNDKKTRLMRRNNRQEVTGLVVNEKANIRRADIQRLRMKIYSTRKYGQAEASLLWLGDSSKSISMHLVGWLAYIRQVRGQSDPVLAKLCQQVVAAGISDIEWIVRLADMTKEFDVFLSHASDDKSKVRPLYESLNSAGVKVFFDESSIKWGDSIVERVNHGLLKSRFFVPVLSSTFSRKGWTNKESNSAIAMNISRKGRILPIKFSEFDLDGRYPTLNDTLYKTWPEDSGKEDDFIREVTDDLIALVEQDKQLG
ncbi:TIR domain-containing anti-phage reverse transcriptase [Roseivivax halotolerans]|uniref:TIR domain-containing anti-phage reverse transcriptase n=1 Tax=Roseivivax halotolerans TaxID=93684 RepID=UPI0015871C65|nr:TIR domain-containing anti-phage reverse transcriptase [Roseivivax halotolerans]